MPIGHDDDGWRNLYLPERCQALGLTPLQTEAVFGNGTALPSNRKAIKWRKCCFTNNEAIIRLYVGCRR